MEKNQYDIRLHQTLRWCVTLSYSGHSKDVLVDVRVSKSTVDKVGYCWRAATARPATTSRPSNGTDRAEVPAGRGESADRRVPGPTRFFFQHHRGTTKSKYSLI